MARVFAALLAITASACFTKPDPPLERQGGDGGIVGDGSGGDSGDSKTAGCTLHDDFNAVAAGCGDWSMPVNAMNSVGVKHDGSTLQIVSLGGGTALCNSVDAVDLAGGARVQITSIISQAYSFLTFEAVDAFTSTRVGVRISGQGSNPAQVVFIAPNSIAPVTTYDPNAMVYWQLRTEVVLVATGSSSRTEAVLEYSPNDTAWTEFGRYNAGSTTFTSAYVHLSATFTSATTDVAGFDNLDACN